MSKFYTQDCLIYCVFLSKEFQLKFFIETSAHRFLNVLSTNSKEFTTYKSNLHSKEFTTYKPNLRTWLQPTLSPLSLCFPSQYKIYMIFSSLTTSFCSKSNDIQNHLTNCHLITYWCINALIAKLHIVTLS